MTERLSSEMSGPPSTSVYESGSELEDAPDGEPETLRTSDALTSDVDFSPYSYNVDDLKQEELGWFEKIKIFEAQDEPDDSGGAPAFGNPQGQLSQPPTDAFGKIYFKGEESTGALPSWYVRLDVKTEDTVLQELLENKLKVMSGSSHPIRIHCIDYSSWPQTEELPQFSRNPLMSEKRLEAIIAKLKSDLYSMCKKTAGIMLTWSGRGGDNLMHAVLGGITEESRQSRKHLFNMATIATPPWKALDPAVQSMLQRKGENIQFRRRDLSSPSSPEPDLPESRASLGPEISQYATHFLLLDDNRSTPGPILSTDSEKSNFRHFHYQLIQAMENSEKKKTVKMPVFCVLINGHHDALKMVVYALQKKIPVLVVKGTGGCADIIADVYMNAKREKIKVWDERGQVRIRITKKAGDRGPFYMSHMRKSHQPFLREIFNNLDLITIYIPTSSVQTLESVIFKALLTHKQDAQLQRLVSVTENGFIDSDEMQMNCFIEALRQNSVDVVKSFLNQLKISEKFMQYFNLRRVLQLYSQNIEEEEKLFFDIRKRMMELLRKMTVFPLQCGVKGCPNCYVSASTKNKDWELAVQRTCLHPIQELFLWTLLDQHVEMALIFWERCEDKIVAALVARRVFRSMLKECSDPEVKWQMEKNIRQFQDLAIQTLRNCHNMDEMETELLLTKPCPWWGNLSVLQVAIMSENREFMTQVACKNIMTRIWRGQPPSDPDMPQRPRQLVDIKRSNPRCSGRWHRCSPFQQYIASFLMQVIFLLLFSYGLLSDLGHGITYIFITLIVWVATTMVEELRQLVSKDPVLRDSSLYSLGITKTKLQAYWSQGWNKLDVITIGLFCLGMVVFVPVDGLHEFGRIVLSIDIFCFFMRTFQMLMVFDELGLMLVMVYKMLKDTINFMIILLIFVLAYAVASESLLYPESDLTLIRFFHLPRKAYWQVFGELSLEEIEIRESMSCSMNGSKHFGYDVPHCPSESGSYIVPILLGVHVMITNVLLLNLLIARFGVTFNKVHDEALQYQAWHRCQIITEYYNRTSFPPPFNILHMIYIILLKCCLKIKRCLTCLCCCTPCKKGQQDAGENVAMTSRTQGAQNRQNGDNPSNSVPAEEQPFIADGDTIKASRSANKRSVVISWTNQLEPSTHEVRQGISQQVYKVQMSVVSERQTPPVPETFLVARKLPMDQTLTQSFTVWDLDPNSDYVFILQSIPVVPNQVPSSIDAENLLQSMEFENKQAERASGSEDGDMSWLKNLQAQTETVQQELGKMAGEMKDNHNALKVDLSNMDKTVKENMKSLQKLGKRSEDDNTHLQNVAGSFEKLKEFLDQGYTFVNKELKKTKEKLQKAQEEKEDAEQKRKEELKKAEAEIKQLQSEKDTMGKQMQDLMKTFEEQHQGLQHDLHVLKEEQEQQQQQIQQQLQAQTQQIVSQVAQVVKASRPASEVSSEGSGQ